MKIFKLMQHTDADKDLIITGPVQLVVDYDDVDHEQQERFAAKVVDILNAHWDK